MAAECHAVNSYTRLLIKMPRFSGLFFCQQVLPYYGAVSHGYYVKYILQQLFTNLHIYSIPLGKKYAILEALNLRSPEIN